MMSEEKFPGGMKICRISPSMAPTFIPGQNRSKSTAPNRLRSILPRASSWPRVGPTPCSETAAVISASPCHKIQTGESSAVKEYDAALVCTIALRAIVLWDGSTPSEAGSIRRSRFVFHPQAARSPRHSGMRPLGRRPGIRHNALLWIPDSVRGFKPSRIFVRRGRGRPAGRPLRHADGPALLRRLLRDRR
jgi:hypothetical protein